MAASTKPWGFGVRTTQVVASALTALISIKYSASTPTASRRRNSGSTVPASWDSDSYIARRFTSYLGTACSDEALRCHRWRRRAQPAGIADFSTWARRQYCALTIWVTKIAGNGAPEQRGDDKSEERATLVREKNPPSKSSPRRSLRSHCSSLSKASSSPSRPASDHDVWDQLLAEDVDDNGLVAYGKSNAYLAPHQALSINIWPGSRRYELLPRWRRRGCLAHQRLQCSHDSHYLQNDLTDGIEHQLAKPFNTYEEVDKVGWRGCFAQRHRKEHGALRPLIGYRAHAVLGVRRASCPPLQRFAYRTDNQNPQTFTSDG